MVVGGRFELPWLLHDMRWETATGRLCSGRDLRYARFSRSYFLSHLPCVASEWATLTDTACPCTPRVQLVAPDFSFGLAVFLWKGHEDLRSMVAPGPLGPPLRNLPQSLSTAAFGQRGSTRRLFLARNTQDHGVWVVFATTGRMNVLK